MLALVRRTRELEDFQIVKSADAVTVKVKRKGQSPVEVTFGKREATALGLSGKDNYTKQPMTMYQWRAVAANLRVTFPDVICGMYTPEEMNPDVQINPETDAVETVVAEYPVQVEVAGMTVDTQSGEIVTPTVETSAGTHTTFDPTKETVAFGKHSGALWSTVPVDYLSYLVRSSKQKKIVDMAKATQEWHKMQTPAQEASVVDEMFPKTDEERQQAQDLAYETVLSTLEEAVRLKNLQALSGWIEKSQTHFTVLSPEQKADIKQRYNKARAEAEKGKVAA
jgi:hypothetical protein